MVSRPDEPNPLADFSLFFGAELWELPDIWKLISEKVFEFFADSTNGDPSKVLSPSIVDTPF